MSSNKKLCILSVGVLLILLSHDALHATTLLCGSTSVDSISSAGQHDSFELSGVMSGDVITLRMNNTTTFLDPHLELRDANDDLVASASGATITVTLPSNGPFTALASDEGNNNTGDYELFLERLNGACNPTPLGCGERNGAALPTTARIHVYTLGNVAPGDVITLRMHATSTFLDPYLEVYDGAGTLVGEGAGATLTLSLASPGPYTVLARDDNYSNGGSYGISLERLNGTCGGTPLGCGDRLADSIASTDEIDAFSLSGVNAGDVITLRMHTTSTFLDPYLELYDGSGALIAEGAGSTLTLTLPNSDSYTVLARDDNYSNGGSYGISLERLNGTCGGTPLGCGDRLADSIASTDEIDAFSLSGVNAGDVVTLRMHATSTFLDPYLELYDGSGAFIAEGAGSTLTLTLPSSGPYTVLARDDNYSNEGTYGIFLQRLDDACVPAPLPCGENVAGSTLTTDEVDSFSLSGFESGDAVTLRMQTSIFLDPLVELYNGSGTLLGEGPGPRFTATLSNGGPFTVLARDDGYNNTGEYFLFPQRFEAPCSAASLALGQSKTGTLSAPARIETYILEGIQPQGTITVCMDALTSFGPGVELYDGNGTLLGSDFEFFDGGTAAVTTTLGDSAPFTVLAMDDGFDDTGDYEISLRGAVSSCASTDTTPPTVMSITPEPGELVSAGSRYLIRWSSADDVGVTSHTVRLSTDGGATFPTVLASDLSGAAQSFLWTVPVSMRSTRARIRVVARDATGATGQAETAGDFVLADDPPPREISYSYDSLSRLTGVEYSDGSTITYVYDEVGNRETMTSTGPVVIHEDGFEGGDTSGWTGATGDLEILSEAARTGSFGLRVNVGCPPASDLVVPDGTVASGTFEACTTVRADAVRIDPGPVLFRAGQRVLLGSGFSVASGGRFTVEIDPTMTPDSSVRDDSPSGAERYAARFSVRLDGLDLSAGDRLALFTASAAGGTQPFRLLLERNAGDTENRLIVEARQDDGSVLSSSGFPVPVGAGWHTVELQWRASDPSAADGRIDVILDGTPHARLTGLDNAAGRIDAVELGAMDPSASSTGFIDLDGFRSQPGL